MDLLYKIFIDPFVQMGTAPDLLVQTLWDGLVAGALYALIALGFVLIFKASGVFNFAQGIMVVFAALTLVGLHERGVPLDPDMNKYDLEHACTDHPRMSRQLCEQVYHDAWARYYTDEHVKTIMRRAFASGIPMNKVGGILTWVSGSNAIEGVHPLQFGFFRRRIRTQRRSGMPIEGPLAFYPRRAWEIIRMAWQWARHARKYQAMRKRVITELSGRTYMDEALAPPPSDAAEDHLVQAFAAEIPKMYGAPRMRVSAGSTR